AFPPSPSPLPPPSPSSLPPPAPPPPSPLSLHDALPISPTSTAASAAAATRPTSTAARSTTTAISAARSVSGSGSCAFAVEVCVKIGSTRLNSSHLVISYSVFCLKKKKQFIVEDTLADEFEQLFTSAVAALKVCNPIDHANQV